MSADRLVTLTEIELAARRLHAVAVRTPLVPAGWLAGAAGARVWLKPEVLQPVGAFKIRGAYNKIASLPEAERQRGVVAHSSGNHAQAVAYAARLFGIPATIVIPDSAPAVKIEATRAQGATVVLVPVADRARVAAELADRDGLVMVAPFDDLEVIAGQGTIGLEIVADLPTVELVLVPVSGGGLISGVAAAVKARAAGARVIGVQPEIAAHGRDSLQAGHPVVRPPEQTAATMADALRVGRLGEWTWAHISALVDDIVTVTEAEIEAAVRALAFSGHLVAEPGGAVTTAALMGDAVDVRGDTVAIVSGGNVDPLLYLSLLGA
jgi:threonine dehydratase